MLRITVPYSSDREPPTPTKFPTVQNPFWPTLARVVAWFMAIICAIWTLTSAYHAGVYHASSTWPTANALLTSTKTRETGARITVIEETNLYEYQVNGRKFNVYTKGGSLPGLASRTPRELTVRYWPAFPSNFILEDNRQATGWRDFTGPAITALIAAGLFFVSARPKPKPDNATKKSRCKKK